MIWIVDTCQCNLEIDKKTWTIAKVISKCSAHASVPDADIVDTCLAESATAALVNEALALVAPGLLFQGGWDAKRDAVLDAPSLTPQEKATILAGIKQHLALSPLTATLKKRTPVPRFL